MPAETLRAADPYANLAASYDRLVDWVIAEQDESPRDRIGDFLQSFWQRSTRPVHDVLEICCGTGLMLADLAGRGYAVTGLDRSAAMLEQARLRLPDAEFVHAELPDIPLGERGFDAVISAATGLNYLTATRFTETLHAVAEVLPPGGAFVFDLFGQGFFDRFFTGSPQVVAAELEDVSYIWTFTAPPSKPHYDMVYAQFLRQPGESAATYTKTRELHRFHPLTHDVVRRAAAAAGFTSAEVTDNYSTRPSGPGSLFDTWTMIRAGAD